MNIPIRKVTLVNERKGTLNILFREYQVGEEKDVIACIQDEYRDTYFKKDFYNPDYIRESHLTGKIRFLVAEKYDTHEIVGIMILKEFKPEEDMVELATQIIKHSYRGYQMAEAFIQYEMDLVKDAEYSALYVLPVTFHDISQRLIKRQGFTATGFFLSVFDMSHIVQSYGVPQVMREGQGIQIRAARRQDAGVLYLPKELEKAVDMIYERLGVHYQIVTEAPDSVVNKESIITYCFHKEQGAVEIRVQYAGRDLKERISCIQKKMEGDIVKSGDSREIIYNLLLNSSDFSAIGAYEVLKTKGYFFTGCKPLCSEKEYLIMHKGKNAKQELSQYVLSEEFQQLRELIEVFIPEKSL